METQEYKEVNIIVPVVELQKLILALDRCKKNMTRIKARLPYDTAHSKLHLFLTEARGSLSTITTTIYAYLPGGEYDFSGD